jgi:aspartyl-tRNA(Asn)/glutamyl-tRNA(Gln) amidotransferase subunit C
MAALAAVDTDGVPPMTHAVPMTLPRAADEVAPSLPVEAALGGAPDRDGDAFRVPAAVKVER